MRTWLQLLPMVVLAACSEYNVGDRTSVEVTTTTDPSASASASDSVTTPNATTTWDWDWGCKTTPGCTTPGDALDTERPADEQVDDAVQSGTFLVDVLWVVDNSSSMGDDQDSLTANFPAFMDYFETVEGVDYHIGVVSTDVEDPSHEGKLREAGGLRWLDNGTADKAALFDEMAQMGTDGSGDESGRAAIHHATQTHANGWNAGFFRDDAALAVVVISDEEDSSSLFGVELEPMVDDFLAFKADPAMVSVSTIVGPVPDGCATADPGFGYDLLRAEVGGVFHSICSADWAAVLEDLAAYALSSKREFFLDAIPDPDTLEVEVIEADGAALWFTIDADFTYDPVRNSITFTTYLPGPLSQVLVHYVPDFGSGW